MTSYAFHLNLPVPHPLKNKSVLKYGISEYEPSSWFDSLDNLSEEFLTFLDELGLTMTYPALIFYTPERQDIPVHIDGVEISDRVVMNWCVGGLDSQMQWFKLKNDNISEAKVTTAGTPYTRYNLDEVELLHTDVVKWPSIVQTGIPHRITNYGNQKRWVISCDISFKSNPEQGMTMKESAEVYKKWII